MNKYLLISVLAVLPFSQAFAAEKATDTKDATINAEFKGEGKIVFELATDQTKKIQINSTEPTSEIFVPAGNYNVTIFNGDKGCLGANKVLEEGKIYKAVSSDNDCHIEEEKSALKK